MNTSNTTTQSLEIDSENENDEVIVETKTSLIKKEETKEEELLRLNMEFDRLSEPSTNNQSTTSTTSTSSSIQLLKINKITYRKATMKLNDELEDFGGIETLLGTTSNIGVGQPGTCVCFGPSAPVLLNDRKYFLSLAKLKFQPTKNEHGHMLHTIFYALEECNVPLGSNRWMDIGFQGCDPATDIRGTGMLGVLQLLYFCERFPSLAHQIHQLSNKKSNKFPLACLGFHFTLECMIGLRKGIFDSIVKQEKSVVVAMELMYVTMMLKFYQGWKVRSYKDHIESIQHFSIFKDELIENIEKQPNKGIISLRLYQKRQAAK